MNKMPAQSSPLYNGLTLTALQVCSAAWRKACPGEEDLTKMG